MRQAGGTTPTLVSRVGDSLTISRHAGEDLVGGFVPDKRPGRLVADRQVLTNRGLECARAAMSASFDLLLGERREPPFHQVEPGGAGGGDRKSTRLNSSHLGISYAVFCLKKKIRPLRESTAIRQCR